MRVHFVVCNVNTSTDTLSFADLLSVCILKCPHQINSYQRHVSCEVEDLRSELFSLRTRIAIIQEPRDLRTLPQTKICKILFEKLFSNSYFFLLKYDNVRECERDAKSWLMMWIRCACTSRPTQKRDCIKFDHSPRDDSISATAIKTSDLIFKKQNLSHIFLVFSDKCPPHFRRTPPLPLYVHCTLTIDYNGPREILYTATLMLHVFLYCIFLF